MLQQLIHNGVVVPEPPPFHGLVLAIRGEPVPLTARQEEMALAWARKQGTPYVQDRTFVANFLADWSRELGIEPPLTAGQVDFEPAIRLVQAEREARACLTHEERKAQAAERKARRELIRETYGHAIVNGERVELGSYIAEPSGIFMGRGKHPLRGRWKEGATHSDITLNLSPDAPRPPGDWAEIVWQLDSLWFARWKDKLSGKLKYLWLGDTTSIKQRREAYKFAKAHRLEAHLDQVREQIEIDLCSGDPKLRMIATACYLIDALCLRVGDEKDPAEADTVGATTLRPEHVTLHDDGMVEFRFLGKDSVLWHKHLALPDAVRTNLEELTAQARPPNSPAGDAPGSDEKARENPARGRAQIFPAIGSRDVNAYLGGILPDLTAKVFRTHHATMAVKESLEQSGVTAGDPDHRKWEAASLANLEAAILCNHTKQAPAGWPRTRERLQERQRNAEARLKRVREQEKGYRQALAALQAQVRDEVASSPPQKRRAVSARYEKRLDSAVRRVQQAKERVEKARIARDKIRVQASIAARKRTWNLGTSLKAYIDPRVYQSWGREVDYDVLENYYPQTLRRRFAWVKDGSNGD